MSQIINHKEKYQQGIASAILCAVLWGILPIYWKSLEPIPSIVIMTYRIVLVAVFALVGSLIFYGWRKIIEPLKNKKMVLTFMLAGLLISSNWGIYIWAVNNDFIIQTSIGYYIEPLIVCLFGVVFFHEKLNKYKLIAIALAVLGVGLMLVYYKTFPAIALGLATTFATYAAIKRKYRLTAILTILYETVFIAPFALIFVIYMERAGLGAIANGEPYQWVLLALAGILTGVPLLLFSIAANRISLITLGVTEYISPSLGLILGVFVYKEPFDVVQFISFLVIWIGLAVFTLGEMKGYIEEEAAQYLEARLKADKEGMLKYEEGAAGSKKVAVKEGKEVKHEEMKQIKGKEFIRAEHENMAPMGAREKRFDMAGDIKRVTGGPGGEVFLISGSEKTAVIDSGMAFGAEKLIENLKKELGDRKLDYVILTHTHYDHVGGLPYLRKEWPELVSLGAAYGKYVFERPNALKVIKNLSKTAWKTYRPDNKRPKVLMEGLSIDQVIKEDDVISLGDRSLRVIETPGHTNCSLSFVLEPDSVIFPGESIGVYTGPKFISAILKSYKDTIASIEKCRKVGAKYIISPHYGQVPDEAAEQYWDVAVAAAEENRDFILSLAKKGLSEKEILTEYTKAFWTGSTRDHQPLEAFVINAVQIIKVILAEG